MTYQSSDHSAFSDPDSPQSRADRSYYEESINEQFDRYAPEDEEDDGE